MKSSVMQIATLFSNAPLEPDGWDHALRALTSYSGAERAHIVGFGGPNVLPFSHFVGMEEVTIDTQIEFGAADPRQSWRLATAGGVLEIVGEQQYATLRHAQQCDRYNDLCEAISIQYGMQTTLWHGDSAMVGLATFRSADEGAMTRANEVRFARVAPYARNAVRMQRAIEFQGLDLTLGVIERVSGAAFLIDHSARVFQMSPSAELAIREGVLQLANQRLTARQSGDTQRLHSAIQSASCGKQPEQERIWLTPLEGETERRWCEVYPLPMRDWSTLFRPTVLVTLHQTAPIDREHVETLRTLMGLTRAEADVALRLANGCSRSLIAESRGSTPGTVSIQIKQILQKTGTDREAEIVANINRLLRG